MLGLKMKGCIGRIGPDRMAVVVGVEGAGRRMFSSLYFPEVPSLIGQIRIPASIKEVIVTIVLDGCHLQNQAEADMLDDVATMIRRWKTKTVRVMLVLGRTDLVCSRLQNRDWIEGVMQEYMPYLKKLKSSEHVAIAHSNLAVLRMRQVVEGDVDEDDIDDLRYFLSRAGHRLPNFIAISNLKSYIESHKKNLHMLSGEHHVVSFLTRSTSNQVKRRK